ncbi:MAG TPA: TonB family protein [Longimicrobium sp.]|jgi:protein TonB|nr:TonB family protein [Longimicrobium sp.]
MFTVVEPRKRRLWSARPIALSVGAHLLVLTGVAVAANAHPAPKSPPPVSPDTIWIPTEETNSSASETTTPQPRVQTKGGFVSPRAPETELDSLPPVDSTAKPLTKDDVTGLGQEIFVVRPRSDSTPRPPAADPPLTDFRLDGPEEYDVEQIPQLASPRDVQRILERVYPPMLRDGGVTGRTTVVLVVDGTGTVVPGSVTVRETSHEGFREAAIRAAERFRFRPARRNGQPFAAVVSLPIEWKILR